MSTSVPGRSNRHRLRMVAVALIIAGLYASVVILGVLDDRRDPAPDTTPGIAAETVVWISVTNVQPATQVLDANLTVIPGAGLVDRTGRLTDNLSVTLHPAVQQPLDYSSGREAGTVAVQLLANGNFQQWPFDRYQTRNLVVEVAAGKTPNDRLIPSRVIVTGAVPSWQVNDTTSQPANGATTTSDVTVHRDAGSLLVDVLLCLILVALPVGAMFVAILTVQSKRPFYATTLGWFAALLFAVVPLRTLFPGAPPLGGWVDRTVVVWVLVALIAAQGLYLYAWWRERGPDQP